MVPDSAFAERALCCGVRAKTVFCWSGGKDSALALYKVLQDERYSVVSLLTTCNETFGRVSMHGVRLELVQAQARAIGLPLDVVSAKAVLTRSTSARCRLAYLSTRKVA
jgi:diphthamide synthase (EF-2-diphthine--ammonia ligase)